MSSLSKSASNAVVKDDKDDKPLVTLGEEKQARGRDYAPVDNEDDGDGEEQEEGEEEQEDDDDEDDEEDENDEDEDEDDDEEEERTGRGGVKRRKQKRHGVSRFVDVEAVVDDDEEEYDEEDNDLLREDGFIEQDLDGDDEHTQRRTAADNQMLDRQRRREEEMDAEQIAAQLRERYRNQRGLTSQSDYEEVPQTLLMPSVNDPGLYAVRCRPGREKAVIQTILRKALNSITRTGPLLKIISAFSRDTLPGRIYVEATEPKHVVEACANVAGAFARDNTLFLVPINEMADLLKITKKVQEMKPGGWVRFKSGKYAGDLAQVIDISENGETVGIRYVPRLDLDPKEDIVIERSGVKRKKSGRTAADRPPQRFFNAEEVRKKFLKDPPARRDANTFIFRQQTYVRGYCEDDVLTRRLVTDNVNPTLDEISRFAGDSISGGGGGGSTVNQNSVDLNLLADATQRKAEIVLRKDDHVEVNEGEQAGVQGIIETVEADVVTIRLTDADLQDQTIEVPIASVRKVFKAGDHIKVIAGKHRDETGLVLKVQKEVTTFLSDMSLQEVQVFSSDIHEAAEVGSGVNTVGGYELHNLVQLDAQTAGVIFKIEREVFMILDQSDAVRPVRPHQITMKRDSGRAVAVDSEGGEFRTGDSMKEVDGEEREGTVLHVYQSVLVWLFNRDLRENGGVFLARSRQLRPRAPRGIVKTDLSKQNPALAMGAMENKTIGGAISNLRRPGGRDPFQGKTVSIVKGPYKTYRGIIKDTNGPTARVELHSMSKVLTIGLDCLIEKDPFTGASRPLGGRPQAPRPAGHSDGMGPPGGASGGGYGTTATNPYVNGGGGASVYGGASRTPAHNPYVSGGKTPAYPGVSGGKTAAYPGMSGGKTPAYPGAGGKTPAYMGAGSKTPAYPSAGGKTPGYNAYGDGGKTPAYNPYVDGGRTPGYNPYNDGGKTPSYGSASASGRPLVQPGVRQAGGGGGMYSAPTPTGAPTPGDFSAPTPGAYAAPTPGAADGAGAYSAPTPGGMYGAPTPGALGAPTPAGGMLGAPTPAGYGQTPYTPAAGGGRSGGGAAGGEGMSSAANDVPLLDDILIRIVPSRLTGLSMLGGRYDGKSGYTIRVAASGATATVMLDDGTYDSARATLDNVAREFIEPLRPNAIRTMCLALTGEHRGKRVIVQSLDGEQVLGQVDGRSVFFDVAHLARAS